MTTFIHTADWQIDKPFSRVADPSKRSLLQQERIHVLGRIADAARAHQAEFVLVAGDLFDSPGATKAAVSAACSAIGSMQIPVLVIPGNHDHGGPGSLWEQAFFKREREHLAPNLQILLKPEPVELDTAVVFPCPLLRRHESADSTAWVRSAAFGGKTRIVLAHGSVQGFGANGGDEEGEEGATNLIDLTRLPEAELDYIALGDWHGAKQVGAKAWYSGTPEIDRFPKGETNEPGHVLAVTARRGGIPEVRPIVTARFGWHAIEFDCTGDASLDLLSGRFNERIGNQTGSDLLLLDLKGSLGIEATTRLEELLEVWEARLVRLKLSNQVQVAPSEAEVEALTRRAGDPLISRVATRLVEQSRGLDDATAAIARIALRELHARITH